MELDLGPALGMKDERVVSECAGVFHGVGGDDAFQGIGRNSMWFSVFTDGRRLKGTKDCCC